MVHLETARTATPDCRPRLSAVDVGNGDGGPLIVEIVKWADRPTNPARANGTPDPRFTPALTRFNFYEYTRLNRSGMRLSALTLGSRQIQMR